MEMETRTQTQIDAKTKKRENEEKERENEMLPPLASNIETLFNVQMAKNNYINWESEREEAEAPVRVGEWGIIRFAKRYAAAAAATKAAKGQWSAERKRRDQPTNRDR